MKPASRMKPGLTVRKMLQERLDETQQSPADLAEAIELPPKYITELMSGRRRPPWPARTDVYEKMTRFLGLGRTDLTECATAERTGAGEDKRMPEAQIQEQFLALCETDTADRLKQRAVTDFAELVDLMNRILIVVQGAVRRGLDDQIPLRIAATRSGSTYPQMRLQVLDFLDATPQTLTMTQLSDFVRPAVSNWDVDLSTGVLRVVLRPSGATERHLRKPIVRASGARMAG